MAISKTREENQVQNLLNYTARIKNESNYPYSFLNKDVSKSIDLD